MKRSGIAKGGLKRGAFMSDIRLYSEALIGRIKARGPVNCAFAQALAGIKLDK